MLNNMNSEYGPFILRLFLGLAFLVAGVSKILNFGMVKGMFEGMVGGAATTMLVITLIIELVSGIFLLLGFMTRLAAGLIAIIMLGAFIMTFKVSAPGIIGVLGEIMVMNTSGSNIVVNYTYFGAALALVFLGNGKKWALMPDN